MSNSWFGPWLTSRWFGPWFPGYTPATMFTGYGPPGVATFAADLESGFKVTWDWGTDVEKSFSGKEKRVGPRDAPKQKFDGESLLLGTDPATVRGKLGSLMALGQPFLLGLQYEGLTMAKDNAGSVVYVNPAFVSWRDWLSVGQRVICKNSADVPVTYEGVIQNVDGTTGAVTLNGNPGAAGLYGCELMPLLAVLFESQQSFDRYPTNAEHWHVVARSETVDFAPPRGSLDLYAVTGDITLQGAVLLYRKAGYADLSVEFNGHIGAPAGGSLTETAGIIDVFGFSSGVTKLSDLATLCANQSDNFLLTGNYNPNAVLTNATCNFIVEVTNFATVGPAGNGATLTTYAGRNVWDWPISTNTSGQDSILSMIKIFDFGGKPVAVATADEPDYGRHVAIHSDSLKIFQWMKKFLYSVRGSQKAFWLPTYRNDLVYISGSGTSIVVSGDVKSWYPTQHDRLMVVEAGSTPVYTQITKAVDNLDGTFTLTLADAVANVTGISWLELCRFENSSFEIVHFRHQFSMETTARVVQQ